MEPTSGRTEANFPNQMNMIVNMNKDDFRGKQGDVAMESDNRKDGVPLVTGNIGNERNRTVLERVAYKSCFRAPVSSVTFHPVCLLSPNI